MSSPRAGGDLGHVPHPRRSASRWHVLKGRDVARPLPAGAAGGTYPQSRVGLIARRDIGGAAALILLALAAADLALVLARRAARRRRLAMSDDERAVHVPVLLDRVLALLAPALDEPRSAGRRRRHPRPGRPRRGDPAPLSRRVRLVGLDRDPDALAASRQRLSPYADRLTLVHAVYDELPRFWIGSVCPRPGRPVRPRRLLAAARRRAARLLLPRGRPSTCGWTRPAASPRPTCSTPTRRGPGPGAARVRRGALRPPHRGCGRPAARAGPFTSSARLVELVRDAIPAAARRTGGNPAKRTFQALRIEVNGELDALERALPAAVAALAVGGRIVVLSYHSLEDRLVKRVLAAGASSDVPADLPVVPARLRTAAAVAHAGCRGAHRRARDRCEPASRLRAAARCRARAGGAHEHLRSPCAAGAAGAFGSARLTVVAPAADPSRRAPVPCSSSACSSAGMVTLLLLNTALAEGSFGVQELQQRASATADDESAR